MAERLIVVLRVAWLALASLAMMTAATEAQPAAPDSATIERRLAAADRLLRSLAATPSAAVAPLWRGDSDRFVYRPPGGDDWVVVDPARNTVRPWPADSSRDPVSASAPALTRRWRDAPAEMGIAITDSAGREVMRVPGEPRYTWGVGPQGWSPNGEFLLALRFDERRVHTIPIVDYSTHLERTETVPYAKPGTPLPIVELHVIDPASASVRRVETDSSEAYYWPVGWRQGRQATEALVLRLRRDARQLELLAIDPREARARVVVREVRPESFVAGLDFATGGYQNAVTVLPGGEQFLWLSERDGWRHVYVYRFDGTLVRQLTAGAFPVHRVLPVRPGSNSVFVMASGDTARPYDQHLYRVDLTGRGWRQLTRDEGMHDVTLAPSGRYFLDRHSSVDRPPVTDLRRIDGTLVRTLERADVGAQLAAGYRPPEMFRASASDRRTPIFGALYTPADFDPSKRYPVLLYIYAGPFLSVTPKGYAPTPPQMSAAALASLGYVVAIIDGRGTPGRSKAFQDATYGRVGDIEIADQVAALRSAASTRPYMALERAGITGHSWGGYFALRGMLTVPELFRVGYAGAPGEITEATIINEPYQGLLPGNETAYQAASNIPLAPRLEGRLKLMHGTSDVNAPLSTTMRIADALIRAGKRFDLLIMPGQPHNPPGAFGDYYRSDVRRYFVEHLPPTR